jgi:hypothetical protein
MEKKEAIEHLDRVVLSIEEAIWLISLYGDRTIKTPAAEDFHRRIVECLTEHLKDVIQNVHYSQYLLSDIPINKTDNADGIPF